MCFFGRSLGGNSVISWDFGEDHGLGLLSVGGDGFLVGGAYFMSFCDVVDSCCRVVELSLDRMGNASYGMDVAKPAVVHGGEPVGAWVILGNIDTFMTLCLSRERWLTR